MNNKGRTWPLFLFKKDSLQIQPVIHFKYNSPVPVFQKRIAEIVVGKNKEDITHGFVSPLKAAVDIYIIVLGIELKKSSPE